jgi:nucleoside-diphosphate-sugar epimerase
VFDLQADSSFRREFDNKSDFYQGDIGELAPLVDLCQRHGVTVIAHLAALTGSKALEQPMSQYRVNMHGTMNLLEAARLTGVRRFVMASTRTVYPSFEGTVHGHPSYAPVPEDHWTEPNRPYEVWKHASERIGSYYQEQYGLEFCAFRFGIYLAAERAAAAEAGVGGQRPMGKLHAIIHNAVKSRATTLPQGGDRLLDLVYVRDIAQAFVAAIDAPAIPETVYNIGGGSPVTLETFIGALETVIPGTHLSGR